MCRMLLIFMVGLAVLLSNASCKAVSGDISSGEILDKDKILQSHDWWDNQDFDWYKEQIPFLETPDKEVDKTYYYRWDMMTKHLIYGSPAHGYTFTEFIDRPGWSGTYGSISCPAGLQLYDLRWFRQPNFSRDYASYYMRVPKAQPRRYSTWLADSVWAIHKVWPSKSYTTDLLEDLIKNHKGWEKKHWVPEMNMFWQDGMADGMETNINSRQTKNWFSGAKAYRPTLNSYLYGDSLAIAAIAKLAGKEAIEKEYLAKAANLKVQLQKNLWDPKREFFFPLSKDEETHDGHTIGKHKLTYQSGKYAGSKHGRELIGYVPWQFNLPDNGYEQAWKFLMDPYYFYAKHGPTVTERNDPLFRISERCCVWSGNSWPFATGQTLKAMANLLQNYKQKVVDSNDYHKLLHTYAISHRKDGKPYIAEAMHPDTGSWSGHDHYNHSEHYFHSSYIDLVISGLIGLKAQSGDKIVIQPLIPTHWDYFCLDNVRYHGHDLTIIWDKTGKKYNKGAGLQIISDGKQIAIQKSMGKLEAKIDFKNTDPSSENKLYNLAVNNTMGTWPKAIYSDSDPKYPPFKLNDGQYWYLKSPPNRWQPRQNKQNTDWCGIDFGIERQVEEVKLYLLDDGDKLKTPASIQLQYWQDNQWQDFDTKKAKIDNPLARRAISIRFNPIKVRKLRVILKHQDGAISGLSEFEAWGKAKLPLAAVSIANESIAWNPKQAKQKFPKSSSSAPNNGRQAIDGNIAYVANKGHNRWETKRRPKGTKELGTDWLAIDFGSPKKFDRIQLHFCRKAWGVGAPLKYELEIKVGDQWKVVEQQKRLPQLPAEETINIIRFPTVSAQEVRLVVTHDSKNPVTALTEIEIFAPEK